MNPQPYSKFCSVVDLICAIVICQGAGILGAVFTSSESIWYTTLNKPVLNPPGWLFGPVWITLYTLMGISAFLVYTQGIEKKFVKKALIVFTLQLILNATWSLVFFGLQNPLLALINIVCLLGSIVWTIKLFLPISRASALLLIPYIVWVCFATYLNFSIWVLN